MASGMYNRNKYNLGKKVVDFSTDSIKIMLLTSSHSFNPDHNVKSDIDANEISGTGYSAGGQALTTPTWTQDNTNDIAVYDADDSSWASATFTARHAACYNDTLAGKDLVINIDFGSDKSVTGGTFTIQFAAAGIWKLS